MAMTANQLEFLKQQENQRHNLAVEATARRELTESARANRAKEEENYRSNVAKETETHRANLKSERLQTAALITKTASDVFKNTTAAFKDIGGSAKDAETVMKLLGGMGAIG